MDVGPALQSSDLVDQPRDLPRARGGRVEGSADGKRSHALQDLPEEEGGVFAAIRQVLQTREPCRLEYRLPGPSGPDERWFEALVTVMVRDGAPVQMLGMCRNVT